MGTQLTKGIEYMTNRIYGIDDIWQDTRLLMEMEKHPTAAMDCLKWPMGGDSSRVELESTSDRSIRFFLDVRESRRSSSFLVGAVLDRKNTQQVRAGTEGIIRIDLADRPEVLHHRNPDGTVIVGSHIHLDIDGPGLRWAFPLANQTVVVPESGDYSIENMFLSLIDSCHITGLPRIEFSLGV